jgi:DNA-binding response OmpR family regulator
MHKILVVDDEASICFAMSEYLSGLGYEVDCAQQVEEAESLLARVCYSVIIADLRLVGIRDMGGIQVIRLARERCPGTKNIVLTACTSAEVEAAVRGYGIDAFLHKPKPLAEVAQIILGLIGSNP